MTAENRSVPIVAVRPQSNGQSEALSHSTLLSMPRASSDDCRYSPLTVSRLVRRTPAAGRPGNEQDDCDDVLARSLTLLRKKTATCRWPALS